MKAILWAHLRMIKQRKVYSLLSIVFSAYIYIMIFRMINDGILHAILVVAVIITTEYYKEINDDPFKKSLEALYCIPKGKEYHINYMCIKSAINSIFYLIIIFLDRICRCGFTEISLIPYIIYIISVFNICIICMRISLLLNKQKILMLCFVQLIINIGIGAMLFYIVKKYKLLLSLTMSITLLWIGSKYSKKNNTEKIIIRSIKL